MVDDVAERAALLGAAPAAPTARATCAARRRRSSTSSTSSPRCSRASRASRCNESYVMELLPTIDSLRWLAEAGPGILDDERIPLPVFIKQKRARFTFEPLGVVGVIAPWNYPWSIPFGEVAIALMAGNGVVLKPASLTPLIGQRIQDVFERAGRARGARAHRARRRRGGPGAGGVERGQDLLHRLGGGRAAGVGEECARRMKGSVLELGGKDPMIVCADANLPNAISGCLWGGFANAGPDLLRDRARLRGRGGGRALRRGRGRGRAAAARGRPARPRHRDRADGLARAARAGQGAGGRRRGGRRHAALRRRRAALLPARRCSPA